MGVMLMSGDSWVERSLIIKIVANAANDESRLCPCAQRISKQCLNAA